MRNNYVTTMGLLKTRSSPFPLQLFGSQPARLSKKNMTAVPMLYASAMPINGMSKQKEYKCLACPQIPTYAAHVKVYDIIHYPELSQQSRQVYKYLVL